MTPPHRKCPTCRQNLTPGMFKPGHRDCVTCDLKNHKAGHAPATGMICRRCAGYIVDGVCGCGGGGKL